MILFSTAIYVGCMQNQPFIHSQSVQPLRFVLHSTLHAIQLWAQKNALPKGRALIYEDYS